MSTWITRAARFAYAFVFENWCAAAAPYSRHTEEV